MKLHKYTEKFRKIIETGASNGIMCHTGFIKQPGIIRLEGSHKNLVDFGTCSYLGLERHPRLIEGGIRALQDHGTRVASSRTYLESPLYQDVQKELTHVFGDNIVIGTTLTLLHQAALPVITLSAREVFVDEYAHASLRTALAMSCYVPQGPLEILTYIFKKFLGRTQAGLELHVHRLEHNNLDRLEAHLKAHSEECWYICDGIYSMHGDEAPLSELVQLMHKYPQLHCYVDDAHSVGITGTNGSGLMYDLIREHPEVASRCVIGLSFVKGLASAGGGLWVGNQELCSYLRKLGQTTVFGCALPSSGLGSLIEAVRLMRTPEGEARRQRLRRNILHLRRCLDQKGLSSDDALDTASPIYLLKLNGLSDERTIDLVQSILLAGYYVVPTSYPAVRVEHAGLRLVSTSEQCPQDIECLVNLIAENLGMADQQDVV